MPISSKPPNMLIIKHVELRNVVGADIEELRYELRLATICLRQKPEVIPGV
jgi:hypothetical protein